jgi:hypothetical protein
MPSYPGWANGCAACIEKKTQTNLSGTLIGAARRVAATPRGTNWICRLEQTDDVYSA